METGVVLRGIDPPQLGQGLHTLIGGDITDLRQNPSPSDRTYPLDGEKVDTLFQGQELLYQLGFDLFDLEIQQLNGLQDGSQLQSQGPIFGWDADALLGKSMELFQLPEFQPSTPVCLTDQRDKLLRALLPDSVGGRADQEHSPGGQAQGIFSLRDPCGRRPG